MEAFVSLKSNVVLQFGIRVSPEFVLQKSGFQVPDPNSIKITLHEGSSLSPRCWKSNRSQGAACDRAPLEKLNQLKEFGFASLACRRRSPYVFMLLCAQQSSYHQNL